MQCKAKPCLSMIALTIILLFLMSLQGHPIEEREFSHKICSSFIEPLTLIGDSSALQLFHVLAQIVLWCNNLSISAALSLNSCRGRISEVGHCALQIGGIQFLTFHRAKYLVQVPFYLSSCSLNRHVISLGHWDLLRPNETLHKLSFTQTDNVVASAYESYFEEASGSLRHAVKQCKVSPTLVIPPKPNCSAAKFQRFSAVNSQTDPYRLIQRIRCTKLIKEVVWKEFRRQFISVSGVQIVEFAPLVENTICTMADGTHFDLSNFEMPKRNKCVFELVRRLFYVY